MKETIEIVTKALSVPLAMLIVGLLVWYALSKGMDGAIAGSGFTVIGGLGGFYLKGFLLRLKSGTKCLKFNSSGTKSHKKPH
jgi:hypothetical protein